MFGRQGVLSGETCDWCDGHRSQRLHSTDAAQAARGAESKVVPREGSQEGGVASGATRQRQPTECESYMVGRNGNSLK